MRIRDFRAMAITKTRRSLAFILLGISVILTAINEDALPLSPSLRSKSKTWTNPIGRRGLSLNLGGGMCKWQPPQYNVPDDIDFYKTAIVGYPSGDKRLIFIQMEALTGWPAKDEWDFEFLGNSNHPFIKANYPHHEGIWGWGDNADQVVMMVRNIRRSMVEYHDILWDIGYAKTWEEASVNLQNLYNARPPMEDFLVWRDIRVIEEAHWYGWFIDYWMEGGLKRDIFTHKVTTTEHFDMLINPGAYSRDQLDYDLVVGDQVVTPSYDTLCGEGHVSGGCEPVSVISAEKLTDYIDGPAETKRIAEALMNNPKISQYVIESEAWDCIWNELIVQRKGVRTILDRPGTSEEDYNFSAEMLEVMIYELDRLIAKYSSDEWNTKTTANRLVELITDHRSLIQIELDEVNSGHRKLTERDILGPKERQRRRQLKLQEGAKKLGNETRKKVMSDEIVEENEDYSLFFNALERSFTEKRREQMKIDAIARDNIR